MSKYVLDYSTEGECISKTLKQESYSLKEKEVIFLENSEFDINKMHIEPYLSEYKMLKIREFRDALFTRVNNHVPGLKEGTDNDALWLTYGDYLLSYTEQFKNKDGSIKTILETEFVFTADPNGISDSLNL